MDDDFEVKGLTEESKEIVNLLKQHDWLYDEKAEEILKNGIQERKDIVQKVCSVKNNEEQFKLLCIQITYLLKNNQIPEWGWNAIRMHLK